MRIRVNRADQTGKNPVVLRCPLCGNGGTFVPFDVADLLISSDDGRHHVGLRRCPNPGCKGLLFFWCGADARLVTFPSLRIDFRADKIPEKIRLALEEAITCHADECYVASAIMVRRTLEELCEDKGIKGDNLKKRVEGLASVVLLPKGLFEAMDELRLLGNDAAHIESREYDQIGEQEVSVAIELVKEILKGVYQVDDLVARLRGLKKG